MIKSRDLLNKLKEILDKDEILEEDLNNIEDLSLNRFKLSGIKNDINLSELKLFKNLKTLTLIKFAIDNKVIEIINEYGSLWAVQFTKCRFEEAIPINKEIDYLVLDYCEKIDPKLINNNETIKIIGAQIDLLQVNNLNNTELLYLQDCQIKNTERLLMYNNLKLLNLEGSSIENINCLDKLNEKIEIYYRDEYNPGGGI